MPVSQGDLDNVRNRSLRRRMAQGLSPTAVLLTVATVTGGVAGLATSELAAHYVAAGSVIATSTKLTVSPDSPASSVVRLAASEAAANGAHPAGWVQFEAGDTDIGAPVAVSSAGVAATTAVILTAAPAAASLRATFTPATTAYLTSATTTAARADGGSGGTGGTITITFTVPPTGNGQGGNGQGGNGQGGTGQGGTGSPTGNFAVTVQPGTTMLQDVGRSDVATGTLQQIVITDSRSPAAGWYVLGQESDFTGSRGARPATIPGTALGWVPTGTVAGGATLGPAVAAGHLGLSGAGAVLAAAASGLGGGTSTLSADLTLAIPASAATGGYIGTLTITYVATAPQPAQAGHSPLREA
jgi:hypothetical protein